MTADGAAAPQLDEWGPSRRAAVAAGLLLCALYAATAAPAPVPWDGPEFAAAYATFGIPHPPGTPLVVAFGRSMVAMLGPFVGIGLAASWASGVAAAIAGALLAWTLARRGLGDGAATVVAVGVGTSATWWSSATEPEAYGAALALGMGILLAASEAGLAAQRRHDARAWRWRLVAAYGLGLAPAVHQVAWVVVPGAVILAWPRADEWSWRRAASGVAVTALGATAVAVLHARGIHAPPALMGDAATVQGTWDILTRAAYESPGWWPRRIGFGWQALMPVQYLLDQYSWGWSSLAPWQVARFGVAIGVVVPLIGVGMTWWLTRDRRMAWALLALLVVGSLGVAWHLNLRLGATLGWGIVSDATPREVRERDTFFLMPITAWGLLTMTGVMAMARGRATLGLLGLAMWIGVAWPVFDRSIAPRDVVYAERLESALATTPVRAVVLAGTDWDAFGLWYAQVAEGRRHDLTVVTLGLLGDAGYRRRLEAAAPGLVPPLGHVESDAVRHIRGWAAARGRPVVRGPWTPPSVLSGAEW